MRKKILALGLAVCTLFSFTACSDSEENATTPASGNVTASGATLTDGGEINLGDYKGLIVYADDIAVSESELQEYVNSRLEADAVTEYVTEGVVEAYDKVKVSYKGTIDGAEFTGGSSDGKVITLTPTGFDVAGFTDGLVGKNVGDTVQLDLTMPSDYSDNKLANKAVHYEVKILSIVETIYPDLTDDYVKTEYGAIGLETVGDFMEYLEHDLYINNIYTEVWGTVVENAEAISYDKATYEEDFQDMSDYREYVIYYTYGYELSAYLTAMGMTQEDWDASIDAYVLSIMKEEMVINKIAEVEGIEVSQEEYDVKMVEYAKLMGYDSVEDLVNEYAENGVGEEEFWYSVKVYKVQEYVANAVEILAGSNPDKATQTTTTSAQ